MYFVDAAMDISDDDIVQEIKEIRELAEKKPRAKKDVARIRAFVERYPNVYSVADCFKKGAVEWDHFMEYTKDVRRGKM